MINNIKKIKNKIKVKTNKYSLIISIFVINIIFLVLYNINFSRDYLVINKNPLDKIYNQNNIRVYISGEVNRPGYVEISKGKTLEYALNQIGGVTNKADISKIDLNKILKKEDKILIPSKNIENNDEQLDIKQDKININTATMAELENLEGVGKKTAEKIIEYREKENFKNVEDILRVKGIGKAKFEKIKDYITV